MQELSAEINSIHPELLAFLKWTFFFGYTFAITIFALKFEWTGEHVAVIT
jgi:hypothetical protein